jgi:hypothetical protein
MKREIPLFIFDLTRRHRLGEADFVSCTDIDNAFVARIDMVESQEQVSTDTLIVTRPNNGISARIEVKRIYGKNPDKAAIRTLLRQIETRYIELTQSNISTDAPSSADCVKFLEALITGNRHNVAECSGDYNRKRIVETSIDMLEHIKRRLQHEEDN